jgi:hypothetical protein
MIASLAFGFNKFAHGDFVGAALEVASGAASLIPGIGTGVSAVIDAISLVDEIS